MTTHNYPPFTRRIYSTTNSSKAFIFDGTEWHITGALENTLPQPRLGRRYVHLSACASCVTIFAAALIIASLLVIIMVQP